MVVQLCSIVNREGGNSRFNTLIPACDWVDNDGPCEFWNCANVTLRNAILVMGICSTVVDFLNMIMYVSEKGFGSKYSIIDKVWIYNNTIIHILWEPQLILNVQIYRGMIQEVASSNVLFGVWPSKRDKSTPLQMIFEMVDRYARPRTSVWGFESTIGLSFTNGSGPLCGMSMSIHIFTCITFRYLTFCRYYKLGRGEWMNTTKNMLDGMHFSMTKKCCHKRRSFW